MKTKTNEIPATVKDWIKPHILPMIDGARHNPSGVTHHKAGNRFAIYVHTAKVPSDNVPSGSQAGSDMVYVEWTAMAGYSDDPMSFGGDLLTPSDGRRICSAALTFDEAMETATH